MDVRAVRKGPCFAIPSRGRYYSSYSERSAIKGSTREARRAGTRQAIAATTMRINDTVAIAWMYSG